MRRHERRRVAHLALGVLCSGLLLSGCSAQVAGMQSPVLHDYGPVEWRPLDRQFDQPLISGPGYSAAVQNDPGTTPEQYLARHAELPLDAREGELNRIRLGIRMADEGQGAWNTGARVQILYADFPATGIARVSAPIVDVELDDLPRSSDMVVLTDVGEVESGRAIVLRIIPGDGPDNERLELGITPHRAPYGGWRAIVDGELQLGALVYDTRYERDVHLRNVVRAAGRRLGGAGTGFMSVYGILVGALLAATIVVWRIPGRNDADGR